jgi:hypothetical protein
VVGAAQQHVRHHRVTFPNQTKVESLLSELCSELGFSLPLRECARFESLLPLGVEAFTDAALVTEGLGPQMEKKLRKQVRDRVEKHFARWGGNS